MLSSAAIISTIGSFNTTRSCGQIAFILRESRTLSLYPDCAAYFNGTDPAQRAIVHVNFYSNNPAEIGAALGVPFGAAGWLALWLHAIGVEIYLALATKESSRLRQISYERQMQRGWKPTFYTGVMAEGVKDAEPYEPAKKVTNDTGALA
nr:hypothetical protein CFP56_33460 [Quercus suber]